MRTKRARSILCLIVSGLVVSGLGGIPAHAADTQTIHFRVTSDGLVTNDVSMTDRRISLPAGTKVKLVFEYADKTRSAHQFSLVSTKVELRSQRIAQGGQTATMTFTVGERGEEFYRLSCELPCIAMEALTDYLILVDRPRMAG